MLPDWCKVSGGGGGTSTGGVYSVSGTIGQHNAGGSKTSGSYALTGGFWTLYTGQTSGAPLLPRRTTFFIYSRCSRVEAWCCLYSTTSARPTSMPWPPVV